MADDLAGRVNETVDMLGANQTLDMLGFYLSHALANGENAAPIVEEIRHALGHVEVGPDQAYSAPFVAAETVERLEYDGDDDRYYQPNAADYTATAEAVAAAPGARPATADDIEPAGKLSAPPGLAPADPVGVVDQHGGAGETDTTSAVRRARAALEAPGTAPGIHPPGPTPQPTRLPEESRVRGQGRGLSGR